MTTPAGHKIADILNSTRKLLHLFGADVQQTLDEWDVNGGTSKMYQDEQALLQEIIDAQCNVESIMYFLDIDMATLPRLW